jgi:hypothetical protein
MTVQNQRDRQGKPVPIPIGFGIARRLGRMAEEILYMFTRDPQNPERAAQLYEAAAEAIRATPFPKKNADPED